ncbi:hypothetical protein RHGRI_025180 [Rhododendron griersonianum]|uniref:Uncharacterized protein n=1 Tax=Rhododendron griersonianum TaxID=479676 RepID=A0AAV6JCD0_9ERIC|nr:hypothetical protein RHGRI_025180 [Rhododendron griersonianum]
MAGLIYPYAAKKQQILSMVVDRCIIAYYPQVPINSTGRVRVYIYNTRLDSTDQEQAQFVFPVGCGIDLYYYGSSYASQNDQVCPWIAKYRLEGSNIRKGVNCKMKAHIKLCTSKHPDEIPFRPPKFKIRSKMFTDNDVDCTHVGYAERQPQLCRTRSIIESRGEQRPKILPGLTYQQARSSVSLPIGPMAQFRRHEDEDPGPSVSQVGSNTSNTILLEPSELAQMVGNVVAQAMKATSSTGEDPKKKPAV